MRQELLENCLVVGPKPSEPHVVAVSAEDSRHLLLEYETGERKRFDASPWFKGEFFSRLGDAEYFQRVRVIDGGMAVGWPEGQDIGPEDLYDLGVSVQ